MQFDPRTVAREIPGIFDEVFPQLTPGIVAHLNNSAQIFPVQPLQEEFLHRSLLQRAMLFELGYTVGERLLDGETSIDWPSCFTETLRRQQVYFDAKLHDQLANDDQFLAETVGRNLANAMTEMSRSRGLPIVVRPRIPGMEWIANGCGDFAIGDFTHEDGSRWVMIVNKSLTHSTTLVPEFRDTVAKLEYLSPISGKMKEISPYYCLPPGQGVLLKPTFAPPAAKVSEK